MKKNILKSKKVFAGAMALAIITGVFVKTNIVSNASAKKGYYNKYTLLGTSNKDEDGNNLSNVAESCGEFLGMQGMTIKSDKMIFAKLKSKKIDGEQVVTGAAIYLYDFKTGIRYQMRNGSSEKNVTFEPSVVGHANDLYTDGSYLYIASGYADRGLVRYKINYNSTDKMYYLSDMKRFTCTSTSGKAIAPSGVEYASDMGCYLIKNGSDIYSGTLNTSKNTFNASKMYSMNKTSVQINNVKYNVSHQDNNTKTLEDDKYVPQSMYYKDGNLYIPLSNATKVCQSIIVVYPLSSSTKNGTKLNSSNDLSFRITTESRFPKLLEIEGVCAYNNKLYFITNSRVNDPTGKREYIAEDAIGYINNFTF